MRWRWTALDLLPIGALFTKDCGMEGEVLARIQCGNRGLYATRGLLQDKLISRRAKLRIWNSVLRPTVIYGCEAWSLTIRQQQRLLAFENRVLRTILGPVINLADGTSRRRTNLEIRDLTQQPLITSVIKSRRLQWAGHVVRAPRERIISRVFHGRPTSPRPLGRPRMRWGDNVSRDAGALGVMDWVAAAEDRVRWRKVHEAALGLQAL